MTVVLFETERVLARQLSANDVDAMYAVYSDRDAMRWVDDGEPISRAECARWVDVTHANYAKRGYGMSALVYRLSGEVFGFCGIVHPDGQPEAEIKYALRREFWGQGLATEVVRAMLAYGARTFHLPKIIATIAPENVASQRVLLKAGMRPAADRRNPDGTCTSVLVWQPASAQATRTSPDQADGDS